MPEILSFDNENPNDLRQNPLKTLWEKFQSLDRFSKTLVITTAFFLVFASAITTYTLSLRNYASTTDHYILMPRAELMSLPTSGTAWSYIVQVANSNWTTPQLQDHNVKNGSQALAAALIYARTGDGAMRSKARSAIFAAMKTLNSSTPLINSGLGPYRQITPYILVADLIDLEGQDESDFRTWLTWALNNPLGTHSRWGKGVKICHADSDNNWGAWCGSMRIAGDIYLGDTIDLAIAANVVKGFYGDRSAWSQFQYQKAQAPADVASWACNGSPSGYLPVNPGCTKGGINLDGAIPADISREEVMLTWPPQDSGQLYTQETISGYMLQTELLYRNGYPDAYTWSNSALKRMGELVSRGNFWNPSSVVYHNPWLLNARYGTSFPTRPAQYGRAFGYTDWLTLGNPTTVTSTPTPTPRSTSTPTITPAPDVTPPTVRITNPPNGAILDKGSLKVSADASDKNGIASIKLYVDGNLVKTCNESSCSDNTPLNSLAAGTHTIKAVATDNSTAHNTAQTTVIITKK